GGQQGEATREAMRVAGIQSVVTRTAHRSICFADVAEFRIWPEQLTLQNRGLIQTATARGDMPVERIWNLIFQRIAHREETWIQLIGIDARNHVGAVIAHISEFNDVVRRGCVLES